MEISLVFLYPISLVFLCFISAYLLMKDKIKDDLKPNHKLVLFSHCDKECDVIISSYLYFNIDERIDVIYDEITKKYNNPIIYQIIDVKL